MSNLNNLTRQEVYDIVKSHLLDQGSKSLMETGDMCAYRGENGTSCAVGCLIPDEDFPSQLEGKDIHGLVCSSTLNQKLVSFLRKHMFLLYELQRIHDNIPVENWPHELAYLAEAHNLVP